MSPEVLYFIFGLLFGTALEIIANGIRERRVARNAMALLAEQGRFVADALVKARLGTEKNPAPAAPGKEGLN